MAEKNQIAPKTETQKSSAAIQEELSSLLTDIDTILAISVLKYFSHEKNPLSISQISDSIYDFRSNETEMGIKAETKERDAKKKKVSRKLKGLLTLYKIREKTAKCYGWDDNAPCYDDLDDNEAFYCSLADLLCLLFGGVIRGTEKGVQKFYFQPMISPSHIDLIKSCLMANQSFTEKETAYLIRAVESLSPTNADIAPYLNLHRDSREKKGDYLPFLIDCIQNHYSLLPNKTELQFRRTHPLLDTISQLYNAITNNYQIEMTLGFYQKEKGSCSGKVALVDSNPKKGAYKLNPYALFFSDGHHYLIATKTTASALDEEHGKDERGKVFHFRVDRILSVDILQVPREEMPESLRDYWKNKKTGFDQQLYSQEHPTMAYAAHPQKKKAILLPKHHIALSIIVDAFGKKNVHITRESATSNSSNAKTQYEIEVRAQEENLVRFCSQQHALVKVLRPQALADQVKETLRKSLADYETE